MYIYTCFFIHLLPGVRFLLSIHQLRFSARENNTQLPIFCPKTILCQARCLSAPANPQHRAQARSVVLWTHVELTDQFLRTVMEPKYIAEVVHPNHPLTRWARILRVYMMFIWFRLHILYTTWKIDGAPPMVFHGHLTKPSTLNML